MTYQVIDALATFGPMLAEAEKRESKTKKADKKKIAKLEKNNKELRATIEKLEARILKLEKKNEAQ